MRKVNKTRAWSALRPRIRLHAMRPPEEGKGAAGLVKGVLLL